MASRKKIEFRKVETEPTWAEGHTQSDILLALNWYNENKTEKDAAKILGTSESKIASKYMTYAWSKRMQERGCKFSETSIATIQQWKDDFTAEVAAKEELNQLRDIENDAISIQERTRLKTLEYIYQLEQLIDAHGFPGGSVDDMNPYGWMVENNVKAAHAATIAEHFRACSKEPLLAASGKDKELSEGYSVYTKAQLLNLLKCYAKIISDAEKIAQNQKVARKPRKKKPVSFEKRVSKVVYLKKEDTLKLQSIDPIKILGSQQLWVYNVKTRKLGVYNAMDSSGLDIKGTKILNFSSTSIDKTLRKPEKTLNIVTDGGKIALRKVLDDVNSKPNKLNGRLNKDTLLLRVVQ